jgi:tyrosyl-tRNA synthetase
MGKPQGGAVWLDPNKTSPYDFYQYWRNVEDADVIKCLRMLTFLPLEEIAAMEKWQGSDLNRAKEILAFELTKLIHGEEEAARAQDTARSLFGQSGSAEHVPSTELSKEDFSEGRISVVDLLVKCGLAPSKGEAKRLIQQGGVTVNEEKVNDFTQSLAAERFSGEGLLVKKGKKVFHRAYICPES